MPTELFKKFRLLKRFKEEFKFRIMKDRIPSYFLHFERGVYEKQGQADDASGLANLRADEMIFVEKLQKIKEKAVLIWLSNGSVQVNFPDCCVLIQNVANTDSDTITLTNKKYQQVAR